MVEYLTIGLCAVGFAVTVALILAELPVLLAQIAAWSAAHRHSGS